MNKQHLMKSFATTITLILLSTISIAQDYAPFSATTSKRFFSPASPDYDDFFFHATASTISGDSIIFDQYYTIQNDGIMGEQPNGCPFWGGSSDARLDTTWLGNKVNWNTATRELLLKNEIGESLRFDFSLAIGSSSLFYTDGITNYFIEHTATNLENFFGVSDSVQIFTINTLNLSGVSVNTPITNFQIRLSKNYGLLSFIECYGFPATQVRYALQGQTNPLIGDYQVTYDELYPWLPGDILQYNTYSSPQQPFTKIAYQTLNVTNRTETADSVFITFTSDVQELPLVGPPIQPFTLSADPIRFKKNTLIWDRPWNMAITDAGPNYFAITAFDGLLNLFGCTVLSQFITMESFTSYCDSCRCFGGIDGFGNAIESIYYAGNVGIYRKEVMSYGSASPNQTAQLTYWNINGDDCGTLWNSQDELFKFALSIAPNPTKDLVKIESDQPIESIRVLDLSGRILIFEKDIDQNIAEISLVSFQKGAYILEVSASGSTQTQTIIRE